MKIKLSKNTRRVGMVFVFIAAVVLGMVLENLRDNRFVVETISDTDMQTAENTATEAAPVVSDEAPAEETAAAEEPSAQEMVTDGKININTAGSELLVQLDGIGEKTAQKIIDYRETNGAFQSIEDIMLVNGIGEKKFEAIKDKICVK